MNLKYLLNSGKNNKLYYYLSGHLRYMFPRVLFQQSLDRELRRFDKLSSDEQRYVMGRVEYYCKLSTESITPLSDSAKMVGAHSLKDRDYRSSYFHDSYEYIRYFDNSLRWEYAFGDVIHIPSSPSIVKSRPLLSNNQNSVLLKLNKNRHFIRINDRIPFEKKRDMAIFRGDIIGKPARWEFISTFIDHPLCDVGDVSRRPTSPKEWQREAMSIYEHLENKFIFALEGNDVASNLKWVMSSNSVAVMPKPTCETWFMEGTLKGGEHFIEIAADFSDIESQLQYYIEHPKEAIEISKAANEYADQFYNNRREKLISLLVLQRYFKGTGQI